MADTITINATDRTPGKGISGKLRRAKQVPAVVYGPKLDSTPITIQQNDAIKYTGHGYDNAIFTVSGGKVGTINVLVKSVDRHPTTHLPTHIDFYAPDMTKTVRVEVEVKFEGKPAGAQDGGVLSIAHREIEIECLPNEIPDHFSVDVSSLELNGAIHVSDIPMPENFKVMSSMEMTLCTCAVVAEEKEADPAAEGAVEGAAPAEGAEKKD
ncbi:MAG: 50S ribosomal protein L25 [Bdellovibrionaceae bacterium]|nr:50S ribosomal protein L25 [Pseudobdellovibrionaceae bacterium]|tara:strand:- start:189275 stop:189907 length:633 start_codon:yes stop_codon:yes gene_type:complete